MWLYDSSTGALKQSRKDGSYELVHTGYSGFAEGKNHPQLQAVPNEGPIPHGAYVVTEPYDSPTHGPFVMRLLAQRGTDTFGRDGFLIHGDSIEHPGAASHGCIIMPREVRNRIHASNDILLVVV